MLPKDYIRLLRPKDWTKNSFLFIPAFFAGELFNLRNLSLLTAGFIAFSFVASSVYILNDYRDVEEDRRHPVKRNRPLASGKVNGSAAIAFCIVLLVAGMAMAWRIDASREFVFLLALYYLINLAYSFGLKKVAILDILLLSSGFVIRVKAGGSLINTITTEWLIVITFLLSLFMAIAKRRDDLVIRDATGIEVRKSSESYNLDFLNTLLAIFGAIIVVAYINYTVSPVTESRLGTYRLYYSSVFVIAGIMRYLQITFVQQRSGSPTEILFRDRFIQVTLVLWVVCIYTLLYLKDAAFFQR